MPNTNDLATLRQYARCFILLMIGSYLMIDKSNNQGSAVLAWTYHFLCSAVHHSTTDIAGCTPLLVSGIYQRFPKWCPHERQVYMYLMAVDRHDIAQQGPTRAESPVMASGEGYQISIQTSLDYRPTREYGDWYQLACRVRHLSGQDVLDNPRLFELPGDV
ncbi:hypothetical protein Ahy_Scaffold2g107628 [Arachis hypogaea]|uniref:Aminotransferase-like plant mobile domain-containing protein n=1 Tax=Arachis hypogaea TaxID=3818 RepID=A0A444WQJ0_ARAHY|nr:hypothetical protein Ahy_Scaffold2g107628 [Arachis hypogaea]